MQPFTTFPFQSPVHLFPEDQLDRIDKIDFEVLRRELLRRLSRSGQTKLNIHQLEYDQQAIIAGLEDFQRSPEQHLRLYRNKPLLAFLETGEATFFETPESWEDVYDPAFQNWLEPYFTARYEYMMYRCVSEKGFLSLNRLRLIDSSKFELPAAYRDRSYQKAFTFLQEMLREARQKTSFTREKKNDLYRIDPIASKYIIPHFMHVFRHLPPYFQPLTTEYINYVHTLFSTAFQKDVAFKTDVLDLFEHSSLVTLSHAAKIIAHHMNKPNLHQFGEMINHYLAENAQNESEEKAIAIYKLSMYAVAFIAFLVICFKYCGKRSNDPADQKAGIETPKADQTIPDVLSVLEGAWYTTTSDDSSSYYGHIYEFHPDRTGISTFYFALKESDAPTCYISAAFNWKAIKNKYNQFTFDQVLLQYTDSGFQSRNCDEELIPKTAHDLYMKLRYEKLKSYEIESIALLNADETETPEQLIFAIKNPKGEYEEEILAAYTKRDEAPPQ